MIKVYRLKIADKVYEVELEDVSEKQGSIEVNASPAPAKTVETKVEEKVKAASSADAKAVEAPMQGVILNISVAVGDTISEGDELVILEAMKMENPILSPYSGTVVEIGVAKGDTVEDGTILVKIS